MRRVLGYLSGAARVSVKPDADCCGARAHILGTISGFKANGWGVVKYIHGDNVFHQGTSKDAHVKLASSVYRRVLADLFRILLGYRNRAQSADALGNSPNLAYERLAVFQALGTIFKKRGIPWVLETNSIISDEAFYGRKSIQFRGLASVIERHAYQNCDLIVCITDDLREMITERFPISKEKVVVIPNAVDSVMFDPSLYEQEETRTGFTVGWIGSLNPWCGVDSLLRSVALLRGKGIDIRAVIAGSGYMLQEYEQMCRSLDLDSCVTFLGLIDWDSIPKTISGFDAAFSGKKPQNGNRMYHSPLKLYEYMAMGTAAVACDDADARDLIDHGVNGFLFRRGDESDLCQALEQAYTRRKELREMGRRARSVILQKHTWQRRVEMLLLELTNRGLSRDTSGEIR